MGIPSEEELDDQVFFLAVKCQGNGLGWSYEEIMKMPPRKRMVHIKKLKEFYRQLKEEYEKANKK